MSPADIAHQLSAIVREVVDLPGDDVPPSVPLSELGVDSLAMIEIVIGIEQQLGVVIADGDVAGLTTVAELTAYVGRRLPQTT